MYPFATDQCKGLKSLFCFSRQVSLCPVTSFVDQADLELLLVPPKPGHALGLLI